MVTTLSSNPCTLTMMIGEIKEKHEDFKAAFKRLYTEVNARMKAGKMSLQELETTIYIEEEGNRHPIDFYAARDRACNEGLLANQQLTY